MRRIVKQLVAAGMLMAVVVGCGGGGDGKESSSGMTESQRDSVLAGSSLPGAGAVKGALAASDSAEARAKRLDAGGH